MAKFIDLTGQRFGRLTVVSLVGRHADGRQFLWKCVCDCGNEHYVGGGVLKMGRCKSCGCLRRDVSKIKATKHGMSNSRIYRIWSGMRRRCNDKNDKDFKNYGGRGIKVCDEWNNDSGKFIKWALENGYKDTLTLDRINVNDGYKPSNCRWATAKEQGNNTRFNTRLTVDGITHTVSEWADILNTYHELLLERKKMGWTEEEILKTPIGQKRKSRIKNDETNSNNLREAPVA